MIKKIEHLGIAVNSIEESVGVFETLLGTKCYKIEENIIFWYIYDLESL